MLIVALDKNGVAFWELLGRNETVDGERYRQFLEDHMRPWLRHRGHRVPLILQDNARPHTSKLVSNFVREKGWEVLPHAPYSPDMHPCDYWGISKIKDPNRGIRFASWDEMRAAIEKTILSINLESLKKGVVDLPNKWEQVIEKEGHYI
jgi:transposase